MSDVGLIESYFNIDIKLLVSASYFTAVVRKLFICLFLRRKKAISEVPCLFFLFYFSGQKKTFCTDSKLRKSDS